MKFSTTTLVLVCSAWLCTAASAQWDYGQHAIDNIIENRIDIRKTRARMQARKAAQKKAGKTTGQTSKTRATKAAPKLRKISVPTKKVVLPSDVSFHRDTYQNFHLDDSKGYVVNFVFTSTSGKVIRKTHNFTYYNSVTDFEDMPIGKYRVVAEAIYQGKKYPVHLGSEDGTSTNPLGGNFAPSMNIEVRLGKDPYGSAALLTLPEDLHVRVIE